MKLQEKLTMLEEIMELEEGTLSLEMNLEEIEEWDSISKLSLMAESNAMGKKLTAAEIKEFKTVGDICDWL